MLRPDNSVNNPATEVSGVIVATAEPLPHNTSDIRIALSTHRQVVPHQAMQKVGRTQGFSPPGAPAEG